MGKLCVFVLFYVVACVVVTDVVVKCVVRCVLVLRLLGSVNPIGQWHALAPLASHSCESSE